MSIRSWSTGAVLSLGLVIVTPTVAGAATPTTPGQAGVQGCRENGQAVATLAEGGSGFGQTAAGAAPIAPINAVFFGALCS